MKTSRESGACSGAQETGRGSLGRTLRLAVAVFALGLCFSSAKSAPSARPAPQTSAADLILRNGRVWTAQSAQPWAEALAVRGSTIVRVGDNGSVEELAGERTRIVDLKGRLAIPGFNDAHIHFLGGSLGLFEVDLFGARSLEEMQDRIAAFARAHPELDWITGAGWEYSVFPGRKLPDRSPLDRVVPDRPVYLRAYDGHTGWANSRALERAGITGSSRFGGYGEIVRDPKTGEPTGILKEGAQSLVRNVIPEPSRERRLEALREGMKLAASLGITSIQNAGGTAQQLELYEELLRDDELTLRVSLAISVGSSTNDAALERIRSLSARHRDPRLRVGAVKISLDGVIESYTAAMLRPYANNPSVSGTPTYTQDALNDLVARCDRAGLQVYIHAIGDRAVRMALDAFERTMGGRASRDARFRIEHIETIAAPDIARFARLGVLPSMQPIHADPGTNDVWLPAVGPERAQRAFAWRSLEKAGARLVFSSDWPAAISIDPIRGIHVAVNRRTPEGYPPKGWIPEQRLSVASALRAYTRAGAYASFEENAKGSLAEGMLADIAVLSRDLFRIDPMEIHGTRVDMTIFDGRIVHGPQPDPR